MTLRIKNPFAFLLIMLCLPVEIYAIDLSDDLTLHGFGTLGMVYNDDNDVSYLRDLSQPDVGSGIGDVSFTQDSLFGLQMSYQPSDNFNATLQVVSSYKYNRSYSPEVTWAFLKYNPTPDIDLRVGRLGLDMFFRSDTRDIGYSYLWSRPPVDYYGQLGLSHFDGFDISKRFEMGEGMFKLKAFYGKSQQKLPGDNGNEILDLNGSPVYGFVGIYEEMNWTLRLGITEFKMRAESEGVSMLANILDNIGTVGVPPFLPPISQSQKLADDLRTYDKKFQYYTLGIAYDTGSWRTQFAYSHVDSESLLVPDNDAAYLSIGYRMGKWTPYAMISGIKSKHHKEVSGVPPPFNSRIDAAVTRALSVGQSDQQTITIGTRFDFTENMSLKIQLDHIDSKDNPTLLLSTNTPNSWDGDANIFSLTIDFIF